MDLSKMKPKAIESVRLLELDGETVIQYPDNPKVYYLNSTATLIWKCCDGKHSLNDMEMKILEVFESKQDQVRADIEEMLLRFYKAHLLES